MNFNKNKTNSIDKVSSMEYLTATGSSNQSLTANAVKIFANSESFLKL